VPPVSAPVQPPAPAPSAFSRTEFHQGHLHEFAPRIVVVGVGGGGGNAVNNMIANELSGESFSFIILNDVILLIEWVFSNDKVMNARTTSSSWTSLVVGLLFQFHFILI
jgi:cell division GTPase FtsZ